MNNLLLTFRKQHRSQSRHNIGTQVVCHQCDQIGRFLNVLGNEFARYLVTVWALLKNITFN